jgi:hypothetical protein
MGVVFAFGSRPALDAKSVEELAAALVGQETATASALANRLRAAPVTDDPVELRLDTVELEALLAALVGMRGLAQFSELQAEAVAEYVGRPREPRRE